MRLCQLGVSRQLQVAEYCLKWTIGKSTVMTRLAKSEKNCFYRSKPKSFFLFSCNGEEAKRPDFSTNNFVNSITCTAFLFSE